MLQLYRDNRSEKITLNQEFFKDLNWFCQFLTDFNGKVFIHSNKFMHQVHVDASLSGLGAVWGSNVYAATWPVNFLANLGIVQFELFNIFVALKIWGQYWANSSILIYCDNEAVVQVANSFKTRDMFLAMCIRNIWLLLAQNNIKMKVAHIPGKHNVVADILSRWHTRWGIKHPLVKHLCQDYNWFKVCQSHFLLNSDI